jgi:hypothetical protein
VCVSKWLVEWILNVNISFNCFSSEISVQGVHSAHTRSTEAQSYTGSNISGKIAHVYEERAQGVCLSSHEYKISKGRLV